MSAKQNTSYKFSFTKTHFYTCRFSTYSAYCCWSTWLFISKNFL